MPGNPGVEEKAVDTLIDNPRYNPRNCTTEKRSLRRQTIALTLYDGNNRELNAIRIQKTLSQCNRMHSTKLYRSLCQYHFSDYAVFEQTAVYIQPYC